MVVRYILGRAGSGKTSRIGEEIKQMLLTPGPEHLVMIVPEQFTLQSERDLLYNMDLPGIIRAEVMSFTRLAARVLERVGGITRTVLNEQGRIMVLRRIIDESSRELTIYQSAAEQPGFALKLGEVLAELKGQGIKPDDLRHRVQGSQPNSIRQKIDDISLLWERFDSFLAGRYLDGQDYLNLFIEKIDRADFLASTLIWIDGFESFSPQNLKIIEQLMAVVPQLTITLTLDKDPHGRDAGLFDISRYTFQKIHDLAQRQGMAEEYVWLERPGLTGTGDPALIHIEKELFSYPGAIYNELPEGLKLFMAANPASEIEYAAAELLALVRDCGWRWRDLALVCNDLTTYASLIQKTFAEYDIPYFMDQKRDIMNNAIILMILTTLEVVRHGYRYEDLFTVLKTGFSGLDSNLVEKIENIALEYGIEGHRWQADIAGLNDESRDILALMRRKVIKPLNKLEKSLAGYKPAAAMVKAHYEYLVEMQVPDQLEKWIDQLGRQGRYAAMAENAQIWNIVVDVFDQLTEILGEQEINLTSYQRLLEAGFSSLEIGVIPTTVDQVLVGDVRRSKSQSIRGLVVVGVNDGILPSVRSEEDLLTEAEKESLLQMGIDLVFESSWIYDEERLMTYSTFSKPGDCLTVSWALADSGGQALRPSLLIERIRHLFPRIDIRSDVVENNEHLYHQIGTPNSTYKYLVESCRHQADGKVVEPIWSKVQQWYREQPAWENTLALMRTGLYHRNQPPALGPKRAQELYPAPVRTSVSRLEQFVRCPFAHFVSFGLQPQPRKTYTVAAPDIGELFHNCLYAFGRRLEKDNLSWATVERTQCDQLVNGIMEDLASQQGNGVFASTYRYRYLVQRLKRIGRRAIWTLVQHLQQGDFNPADYEVSFGLGGTFPAVEIELEDGQKLYLQGRIDRVDLLELNGQTYVKIIDYKSGVAKLALSDIYQGLSLQLMVYLQAVLAGYRSVKGSALQPAGAFYFRIDDPLVNTEARVIAQVEREIAAKLKMSGIVLKDVTLVRAIDSEVDGGSCIIPAGLKANGEFSQRSSVLEPDDFQRLFTHLHRLLVRIGTDIRDGQVRIEPFKKGRRTACQYCEYLSVCQFDRKIPGNTYRVVKPMKDEEVIAKINSTQGGGV